MNAEYIMFFGAAAFGTISTLLTMYLIYRRGIAIRLTLILMGCILPSIIACYSLGKEGISIISVSVLMAVLLPVILGLMIVMIRTVVTPVQQLQRAAEAIAEGNLNQKFARLLR